MRAGPYRTDSSDLSMIQRLLVDERNAFIDNYQKIRHDAAYPDINTKLSLAEQRAAYDIYMQKLQETLDQCKVITRDIDDPWNQNLKIDFDGHKTICSMAQEGQTSGGYYATPNISIGRMDPRDGLRIEATLSQEFGPGGHTYIILATPENLAILHHIYVQLLKCKLHIIGQHAAKNPQVRRSSRCPQRYEDKSYFRVPKPPSCPRLDTWMVPKGKPFDRVMPKKHLIYLARFDLA